MKRQQRDFSKGVYRVKEQTGEEEAPVTGSSVKTGFPLVLEDQRISKLELP